MFLVGWRGEVVWVWFPVLPCQLRCVALLIAVCRRRGDAVGWRLCVVIRHYMFLDYLNVVKVVGIVVFSVVASRTAAAVLLDRATPGLPCCLFGELSWQQERCRGGVRSADPLQGT